jgi:hypothetical protein
MKTKVYANFNAEIYEIMNEDGTYTGFQATDFQALIDTCEEHGFMLTHVDGSDD